MVLAVEPNKTLSYTWNFAHDDAAYNLKSVVTFTLTPTSTGTHLRVEQSGFEPDQRQAFGGARVGMAAVLREAGAGLGADRLKSAGFGFGSYSKEVPLNWNKWVRQIHRWLAIAFTVAVIVNIVVLVQKEQAVWVGLLALFPLALLMLTGLYMFVLPYIAKLRSARSAGGVE